MYRSENTTTRFYDNHYACGASNSHLDLIGKRRKTRCTEVSTKGIGTIASHNKFRFTVESISI